MSTQAATKLMTAEEFFEFDGDPGRNYELIQGELIEMSKPGSRHAELESRINGELYIYLKANPLGKVLGESGFKLETSPDVVRAPDVSFFVAKRASEVSRPGFRTQAPDLAVEINSPHDVMSEVLDKARWWLRHGTLQVWVVDDKTRTVTVYLPDGTARIYGDNDTLTADPVLPGFSLPLAELFA